MPDYSLVFTDHEAGEAPPAVHFAGSDAGEALILAQRHHGPAELWADGRHICTLRRSGKEGRFWIISNSEPPRRTGV